MSRVARRAVVVLMSFALAGCGAKDGEKGKAVAKADATTPPAPAKGDRPPRQDAGLGDILGGDVPTTPKVTGGGFGDPSDQPNEFGNLFKTDDKDGPKTKGDPEKLRRVRQIVRELDADRFFVGPFYDIEQLTARKLGAQALRGELQAMAKRPDPKRHDVTPLIAKFAPRYTRREVQDVFQYKLKIYESRNDAAEFGILFKQAYGYDLGNLTDANAFGRLENQYTSQNNKAGLVQIEDTRTTWNQISSRLGWDWLQNKDNLILLVERIDVVNPAKK